MGWLVYALWMMTAAHAQGRKIAKLKYSGGGDWYANKTALPNLIRFANEQLGTRIAPQEDVVEPNSADLLTYPFVYMTGHGHFYFSESDARNIRAYLLGGGFLHIDDNYGMDPYVRAEMKKVFPEYDFVELPLSHSLYVWPFAFAEGIPKIHEHDGHPPQGLVILHKGRVLCYYSYESDLGNGWEDASVYNNPESLRLQALRMGANLIAYAFLGDLQRE